MKELGSKAILNIHTQEFAFIMPSSRFERWSNVECAVYIALACFRHVYFSTFWRMDEKKNGNIGSFFSNRKQKKSCSFIEVLNGIAEGIQS